MKTDPVRSPVKQGEASKINFYCVLYEAQKIVIKLTYQSSTFFHIDRNQKEGRWVMIPDVGKSITAYYDLDFYENFLSQILRSLVILCMWVSWRHS